MSQQNSSIAKEESKAHQVKQIRTKSIGNPNENMLNDDEPDERMRSSAAIRAQKKEELPSSGWSLIPSS